MAIETLDVIPNIQPFAGVSNAWTWKLSPKFKVFATLTGDGYLFQITMRDHFDEYLARSVLLYGLENKSRIVDATSKLLPEFSCPPYEFESVVALSPRVHKVYESEFPDLNPFTYVLFPAYACEFTGDETAEILQWVKRYLPRVDMKRDPWPQAMRYERDGDGKASKVPIKPDSLKATVLGLKWRQPGEVLMFENFRRQTYSICLVESRYHITIGDIEKVASEDEILELLNRIVVDGEEW